MSTAKVEDAAGLGFEVDRSFIAGRWVSNDGADTTRVVDPATEKLLADVRFSSAEQVRGAIASAQAAMEGPWRSWTPQDRSRLLHRLCDELESRSDQLVELLLLETGSPIFLAETGQFASAVGTLRWFAEAARRGPDGWYERGLPLDESTVSSASVLLREPVGVVAAITAYNYPLLLLARKLGGILASGSTCVVMPSERAPLTTIAAFDVLAGLGLPDGVVNLVLGGVEAGTLLSTDPAVDMVSFTGSAAVGGQIMAQAAPTAKKVVLELGGKSPTIVLPSADIDTLIGPATQRYTIAAGQGCGCTTRTLVPRPMVEEFVEATERQFSRTVVGDPRSRDTFMGPLIRDTQRSSVEGYIGRALDAGGAVLAGGGRPDLPLGYFMNPTLIGGLDNSSEIAQHELFGPVGVLLPYDDVEEAVAIANDSKYGLYAAVWGSTPECMRVARKLRTGNVAINGGGGFRYDMPWGGPGASGVGREGGEDGFREFFETKHVQWPL